MSSSFWKSQLSIRNLLVVSIVILSAICVFLLRDTGRRLEALRDRTLPGVDVASELRGIPEKMQLLVMESLWDADTDARANQAARFLAVKGDFERLVAAYEKSIAVEEDRQNFERLKLTYSEYAQLAEKRYVISEAAEKRRRLGAPIRDSFSEFDSSAERLYTFKRLRADMWSETSYDRAFAAIHANQLIVLIALVLGAGLLLGAILRNTKPASPSDF